MAPEELQKPGNKQIDRATSVCPPLRPSPVTAASDSDTPLPRTERSLAFALLAAGLLLRVLYALRYRMDTDEPQHLHVAWGWANGLLQYRDLFDNHMPLFHILASPLVRLLGDRPDLLIWMRLAMLPLYAASLACVYWIGRSLWSPRVALWATVWAALLRPVFLDSVEFRADNLWMACWLLSVALLVRPNLSVGRGFLAGLALGTTLGVSQKTSLLLIAAVLAFAAEVAITWRLHPWRNRTAEIVSTALAILAGMAIVPLAIVLYFCLHGAFGSFWYAVVTYNRQAFEEYAPGHWLLVPAGLANAALGAWIVLRASPPPGKLRQLFLVLLSAIVLVLLGSNPITSRQNYLVIYPLLAVLFVVYADYLLSIAPLPARLRPRITLPVIALAFSVIELGILAAKVPSENQMAPKIAMWRDVLRLTDPGQLVMDLKGELIFRPRAYFPVLETVAEKLLEDGTLPDDIPECLAERQVCVVSAGKLRLPPRAKTFIRDNYVSIGRLLVTGKRLEAAPGSDGVIRFDVAIPARYALLSLRPPSGGSLDGKPYDAPRHLDAGPHVYQPAPGQTDFVLVWAQAVERGFMPVGPRRFEAMP